MTTQYERSRGWQLPWKCPRLIELRNKKSPDGLERGRGAMILSIFSLILSLIALTLAVANLLYKLFKDENTDSKEGESHTSARE